MALRSGVESRGWHATDHTRARAHAQRFTRLFIGAARDRIVNLPGTLEADGESYTQERVFGREQRLDMTVYWWQHYRTHDADTRSDVAPCSNYCCKSRGLECTSWMIHGAEND